MKRSIQQQLIKDFGGEPVSALSIDGVRDFSFTVRDTGLKKAVGVIEDFLTLLKLAFGNEVSERKIAVAFILLPIILIRHPKRTLVAISGFYRAVKLNLHKSYDINFKSGSEIKGSACVLSRHAVVLADRYSGESSERTLSHEAMHLLQYRFIDKDEHNELMSPSLECAFPFGHAELDGFDESSSYLLNRYELEVIIHELVRHHYAVYKKIPQDIGEFKEFAIEAFKLGVDVDDQLGSDFTEIVRLSRYESVTQQNKGKSDDNSYKRIIHRIIDEWLAPCYANLLQYYGDENASLAFKSQIKGPNLYNRVYRCPH
ncbi:MULTISPECIES: hypothetical protein [Vibrio]|uniref:Uncharacterized protein n=1 Tax=Vibrio ezurae NBRC 102218 TaxID=1219080 RepID=U3AIK3_9VIBR|nr:MULTISPECIES: hypothetical protein [Vibrio]GAD79741.1 hypothetical protein VEZ01S_20_00130 [Vibrio ezurae NBRC 102218]